jgi:hypothetical protein
MYATTPPCFDLIQRRGKKQETGIGRQGKRVKIFNIWAHFRRSAPETGLSAPIPQPLRGFRYFRFYPLREPKPLRGFG